MLIQLVVGFVDSFRPLGMSRFVFDVSLSALGTALAVSAAKEFKHKNVKNFGNPSLTAHTAKRKHSVCRLIFSIWCS